MLNSCSKSIAALHNCIYKFFIRVGREKDTSSNAWGKTIEGYGYSYDSKQDIFYSTMDPWQRRVGYCRLYDEAAAAFGIIIDCEPICFSYNGRRWLIQFWKGQYALSTGAEIGVYNTVRPDLNIPGVFKGPFYDCVPNSERLKMSFALIKNGKRIFTREGKHWWLSGFRLGQFSEPSELEMNLSITLRDKRMCEAFLKGLMNVGYLEEEIRVSGNEVSLNFGEPRTPQPITRTRHTDWIIQRKNKLLCYKYQNIAELYDNLPDRMKAIQEQLPELYEKLINVGKSKQVFEAYEKIMIYLNK